MRSGLGLDTLTLDLEAVVGDDLTRGGGRRQWSRQGRDHGRDPTLDVESVACPRFWHEVFALRCDWPRV
jgi:hypothetical protein